jgi:hypothetical protein
LIWGRCPWCAGERENGSWERCPAGDRRPCPRRPHSQGAPPLPAPAARPELAALARPPPVPAYQRERCRRDQEGPGAQGSSVCRRTAPRSLSPPTSAPPAPVALPFDLAPPVIVALPSDLGFDARNSSPMRSSSTGSHLLPGLGGLRFQIVACRRRGQRREMCGACERKRERDLSA